MVRNGAGAVLAAMVFVAQATAFSGGATARPLTPAENRYSPYTGAVPFCDDPSVLSRIEDRFVQRERDYWQSGLQIVGYDDVREIGYRTTGLDYIPRRYCRARATMNDQKVHDVAYWVGEDLGMIGWGFGVEWCVVGLDRNNAFGPNCRSAGP